MAGVLKGGALQGVFGLGNIMIQDCHLGQELLTENIERGNDHFRYPLALRERT